MGKKCTKKSHEHVRQFRLGVRLGVVRLGVRLG